MARYQARSITAASTPTGESAAFFGAIWIDQSGLSTSDVRQWMQLPAGEYLINGSGGIGWGLAAAVGVAVGNPRRQVVAIIGDGSALYASGTCQ